MKNNSDKFRNVMTNSREEKKFSKTQLASMTNRSVSMICDIEAGRKNPSVSTLVAIAVALNISLDTIFLN